MSKNKLALALASSIAILSIGSANADAKIYGQLGVDVQKIEKQKGSIESTDSFIGIKGTSKLNHSLTGVFQAEFGVDTTTDSELSNDRVTLVGVEGSFGGVYGGKLIAPHYSMSTSKVDIFQITRGQGLTQDVKYMPSSLAYVSPEINGFQGAIAVMMEDSSNGEDVDAYNLAFSYSYDSFVFGLSGLFDNVNDENDSYALSASYELGQFYVAALYQDKKGPDITQFDLVGSYTLGDNVLSLGYTELDGSGKAVNLEAKHNLSKNAHIYAGYLYGNKKSNIDDVFSVGYQIRF